MMIGHHYTDAVFPGQLDFLLGGDAGIHCNEQADVLLRQLPNGLDVETVPLTEPVGDIILASRPFFPKIIHQQAGGRNTIHIIVAKNSNFFILFHGPANDLHRLLHLGQQKRIVQPRTVGRQKFLHRSAGTQAAGAQHLGHQKRNFHLPGQPLRIRKRTRPIDPSFFFHGNPFI